MKTLREYCLAKSTEDFICGTWEGSALVAFNDLTDAVANGDEELLGYELCLDHQDKSLFDIMSEINGRAVMLERHIKHVMSIVKAGLVEAAIEGTLDSDANAWDMIALFNAGIEKAGGPHETE